jgi:hypothetical protein
MTDQEREGQLRSLLRDQARAKIEAEREARERARAEASPEGQEKIARELLAKRQAREEKLMLARVKLQEEGFEAAAGVSVEDMSEAAVLHYSRLGNFDAGIASQREKNIEADRLVSSGEWSQLNEAERWEACKALNITSPEIMDGYIASLIDHGDDEGTAQ